MPSRKRREVDEQSVFLNVPFDSDYAPLFVALIAGLTALGRSPRSVLEIQRGSQTRLTKIFALMARCGSSIHDLSRVELSGDVPRFNMPFELGLAYAVAQYQRHSLFVFERQAHRLNKSLSDFGGHDPVIHEGTQASILHCVLDCFATPTGAPSLKTLKQLTEELNVVVRDLQAEAGVDNPFRPNLFRQIVELAAKLARSAGLIG